MVLLRMISGLILAFAPVSGLAQMNPSAPEYHVELMAVGAGVESGVNAPWRLSAKDVLVSGPSAGLQVAVHRFKSGQRLGDPPPHLLVLFLAPPTAAELAEMTSQMPRLKALGWQVSIATPDRTIVSYGSLALSAGAGTGTGAVAVCAPVARPPAGKAWPAGKVTELNRAALDVLEAFPGRRVLLLNPRGGTMRQDEIVALLVKRFGQIYVLDGGVAKTQDYDFDAVDPEGGAVPGSTVYTSETRIVHNYDRGFVHERTAKQAVSDLLRDQKNYYDVVLKPAAPGQPIAGEIAVRLRDPQGSDVFEAELYGVRAARYFAQRVPIQGARLKVTTIP